MPGKFPVATIALLMLSMGAIIGLPVADQLSQSEPTGPMVASIQAEEDRHQHGSEQPEGVFKQVQEAERKLAAVHLQAHQEPQRSEAEQPGAAVKQQQDEEERKLSDALRWAENYRQGREANQSELVFKQLQEEERKVAEVSRPEQQEVVSEQRQDEELKLADARKTPANRPLAQERADEGGQTSAHLAKCTGSCGTELARSPAPIRRAAPARRAQVGRAGPGCPWLAWWYGAPAERQTVRRTMARSSS